MDVDNTNTANGTRNSAAPLDSNGYLTQKASQDVKELVKNQKANQWGSSAQTASDSNQL